MIYINEDGMTTKGKPAFTGFSLDLKHPSFLVDRPGSFPARLFPRMRGFTRCSLDHIIETYMLQTGMDREDIEIFKVGNININKNHWSIDQGA